MRITHTFTVAVPVEQAWDVLLDVAYIAPCMPGATLGEVTGDSFTGQVAVKLGPVSLTYQGNGRFVTRDVAGRTVVIEASGRDRRGAGTAAATVTATLHPDGGTTRVDVATDLNITGRAAQYGRGMIADVSAKLIDQFADCLSRRLATRPPGQAAAMATVAAPAGSLATDEVTATATAGAEPVGQPHAGTVAVDNGAAPVAATAPTPATAGEPDAEAAKPVDLLAVAGIPVWVRRMAPYVIGFAAGAVVVWLATRR